MVMFCWFFQAFLFGVPHSFVSSTRILLFYVFSCICFSFPTITANGFLKYGIIRTLSKTNSLTISVLKSMRTVIYLTCVCVDT